ncbi:hypothetical protein MLD38_011659 [Melastoma candidum]|uniref:Uncharacterized protein n=1 Tax=Melastoma candidum TaxID=119954 RepID=A0ACB9R3R7_9MYRT|nr:hypothetical protein MLD38_011659 [Melastoma candidum]
MATRTVLWAFLSVLVLRCSVATSSEVEDESEFNYHEDSVRGPARWGELRSEWRSCSSGTMQSPIDLSDERVEVVSYLGRLSRSYRPSSATLKNRGHDIMLKWEQGAGYIRVNGTRYMLRQCHWHSPSEHSVDGRRFDLELHMVHEGPNGEATVVGVMYKLGRPDSFLSSVTSHVEAIAYAGEDERQIGMVNPKAIQLGSRKYYRYIGSLTIPPCTQNVQWTIVQKVRTVSKEQVKLLREAVRDYAEFNARPLQPINGRPVQLFRPSEVESESNNNP